MKIIELVMADGSITLGPSAPVPDDFDVQQWASRRWASLHLLGVVRVQETFLEEPKGELK
jgi:hypothetical protein